tara:strand:+ start:559 stop:1647 length:1089 start_codon:yes stop_codon:yes gene_type:complete
MSNFPAKNYKVGSLFCGIGGICLGFKKAGAEVVWANDNDKHACITYRANFDQEHNLIEDDAGNFIRVINDYPGSILRPKGLEVDIIVSGFPCQAFSIAGYQNGFSDARGNHFFETLQVVRKLKPKAFLLENVRNLQTHDGGKTFQVIKEHILKEGYSFIPKILNTKDFGNLPQTRERIYIVGFRDEASFNELELNKKYTCSFFYKTSIDGLKKAILKKTFRDFLENGNVGKEFYYHNNPIYPELLQDVKRMDTVYQWRRKYVRENKSNVCPTLTANMGTGGHNVPLIKDAYGIRKLTPRECFSLQGFPKSFKLPKNLANSHLYKQAGNSVSVPVIQRIAERIIDALNQKYKAAKNRKIDLSF